MNGLRFIGPINSGAAAGSAGSATADADYGRIVSGLLVGVYVRYNDSPPGATTDVTLKTKGNSTPSYNLLVLTDAATDGLFLPRLPANDTAGGAETPVDQLIPVHDDVNVAIAGANAGDSADVWLLLTD